MDDEQYCDFVILYLADQNQTEVPDHDLWLVSGHDSLLPLVEFRHFFNQIPMDQPRAWCARMQNWNDWEVSSIKFVFCSFHFYIDLEEKEWLGYKKKSQVSELDKYLLKDQIEPECSKFIILTLCTLWSIWCFPSSFKVLGIEWRE